MAWTPIQDAARLIGEVNPECVNQKNLAKKSADEYETLAIIALVSTVALAIFAIGCFASAAVGSGIIFSIGAVLLLYAGCNCINLSTNLTTYSKNPTDYWSLGGFASPDKEKIKTLLLKDTFLWDAIVEAEVKNLVPAAPAA